MSTSFAPLVGWRNTTAESHKSNVEQVVYGMRQHLQEDLTLEDLADIALMTPFHFSRVFRHVTGVSPCRFLWMLRLEAAKQLLVMTDRNVIEICYEVGYNSLGTFTRRFTKLVGIPPVQFRRMATDRTVRWLTSIIDDAVGSLDCLPRATLPIGRYSLPASFDGLVLIGMCPEPISDERPLCCTVVTAAGQVDLASVPEGRFVPTVVGMKRSSDPCDLRTTSGSMKRRRGPRTTTEFSSCRHEEETGPGGYLNCRCRVAKSGQSRSRILWKRTTSVVDRINQ
jgi:AraC-like DNA-binding protein